MEKVSNIDIKTALEHKVSAETARKILENYFLRSYSAKEEHLSSKFVRCPVCGGEVNKPLATCPNCGADLVEQWAKKLAAIYTKE